MNKPFGPSSRKEWTLLTISAAKGEPLTPVQLQKSLFLLGEEYPSLVESDFYNFSPYHYGPFCSDIYLDAELLQLEGLIDVRYTKNYRWREYLSTNLGLSKAEDLFNIINAEIVNAIFNEVEFVRSKSFRELIKEIYKRYPQYSTESVFRS